MSAPADLAALESIVADAAELDRAGLRLTVEGSLVEIVLDRPDTRNAQTPATWSALTRIGEAIAIAGDAVTGVVVHGAGEGFSSGLDRRMFTPEGIPGETSLVDLARADEESLDLFIQGAQSAFAWWRDVRPVTIAAVHGHAVGAGFQLALACDLVIAAPGAQFAMRETSWGLVPDLGGTWPLVVGAGYGPALEACATGRWISAAELAGWGLALEPHEEPVARARALLAEMAATPPGAVADLKELLAAVSRRGHATQRDRERTIQRRRIHALARLLGGA